MTEQATEKQKEGLMMKLLRWREEHVSESQCVIILALLTGIISGLAAVLLKRLIESISEMITSQLSISEGNFLYLVTPIIGILIVGIYVRYVVKDNISHGVTQVLYAISQKKSRLKIHNMYTSVVASSITIGFGGSRRPYSVHRSGYRFEFGQYVATVAQDTDGACGMRCGSWYCRHLQSPDSGCAVYGGGANARPYGSLGDAAYGGCSGWCNCFVCLYRL